LIDVVIPVYGQVDLALRCIKSVLASKNRVPFQLIVIDDGSPDPRVFRALKAYAATKGGVTLLRNPENLGFPATCNRAFALNPTHDVVLLNSDTVVFSDWLDRLHEVATSDPAVGTVTPFTNSGTIASYPHWLEDNESDPKIDSRYIDQISNQLHRGKWVEAPTGVGFCMLFTRPCLVAIGNFDADAFGTGYGEENDFCQRAVRGGWKNAITSGVYVHHDGGQSFGSTKSGKLKRAIMTVERRNPGYQQAVSEFIRRDPQRLIRAEIDYERIRQRTGGRAVLMITHNLGGGTERHVQELAQRLEAAGTPVLFCRPWPTNNKAFRISDPFTPDTPNINPLFVSEDPDHFVRELRTLGVRHVHVHNLVGYDPGMARYLTAALLGSPVSYDITVHDFLHWCPQINMVGITGQYCGEPDLTSCESCVRHLGSAVGAQSVWEWRDDFEILFRGARKIFTPSNDTAQRLERQLPGLPVQVRPHEAIILSSRVKRPVSPPRRLRVGVIGAISEVKGREVLARLATYAANNRLPVTFVVIGYANNQSTLTSTGKVRVTGNYAESELDGLIDRERIDVLFFPAVWPETYSYTLTSALKAGLPIVTFDIGAIPERLRAHGVGTILPLDLAWSPKELVGHLISASKSQRTAKRKVQTLPYPNLLANYYGLTPVKPARHQSARGK
jgi:GT2 family glycosyltransferase/glycosyltransferase involved in cell wall biosynthesis